MCYAYVCFQLSTFYLVSIFTVKPSFIVVDLNGTYRKTMIIIIFYIVYVILLIISCPRYIS